MKRQRLMKLLSLVLSICLLVSTVFTGTVISAEGANDTYKVWDGTSVSSKLKGEGTQAEPYLISSAADLLYLAENSSDTNTFDGKYFLLKCNIDLDGHAFPMIYKFSGIFDGNGYEIKGLKISQEADNLGFFSLLDGTVKNLTLDGSVSSNLGQNIGGFAGSISASGVTLVNCVNKVNVTGYSQVGGFIGNVPSASVKIFACINDGNVTATSTSNENDAGGFIGYASANVSEWNIAFSQNNGNITTKMYRSGGLVGRSNAPKFVIKYCVNNGTVKGFSTVGGLLSYNASNGTGTITNSVNLGKITSTQTSGSASLGAIVGYYAGSVTNVTVTNSYYCQSDVDFTVVTNGQSGATPKGTAVEKTALTDGTVVNNLGVFYVQGTNGPALRQYSDGSGSIDNPYVLKTKEELIMLSQMINVEQLWDYPDALFTLGNDIDLEGDARFVGIGNGSKSFKGDFDGKGYTVSGLDLKHAHTLGLGFFGQIGGSNARKISNLTVEGNVESTATTNTATKVGGLVGKNTTKLTIENCSFNGTVKSTFYKNSSGTADNNYPAASGLVCSVENNLDINHCSVAGTIDGYGRGGSFIGLLNGNYVVNITNSYSVADVTGKGSYTDTSYTSGGLIGFLATGTINLSNCFYDGKAPDARTNGMAGPIINQKASGTFNCENTYFNSDKNTVAEAAGYAYGVGKTTSQFKNGNVVTLLNQGADEKIFKQGETHPEFWVEGDEEEEIKYDIWDGTSKSDKLEGSGTIDDPYLIQSGADLNYWATKANTQNEEYYYSGKYFRLTTNIDLNEKNFPLIYKFTGTFDGNGYEIMGIKAVSNTLNDIGFFRILGGTVKNLTLSGLIWGATNVGGFAGDASSSATLINCVNNLTVKGTTVIGGFIGNGSTATINLIACINNGEILSVTTATGKISLGGMIGYDGGTVNISYSQNNGYVHHDANGSSTDIGGFVGAAHGTHTFNNCVNRGDIRAGYAIGGFIGWNRGNKPMTLNNCINLGGIYGTRTSSGGWLNGIDGAFTNNSGAVTKDKVYSLTGCLHFSGEATDNQAGSTKYIPTDIALSTFTNENVASYLGHLFVLGEDGYPVLREFFDGCGSQEKPYVINTKEELIMLSQMVTVEQVWDFPGMTLALGSDIDLESDIRFVGIGNGNKSYKGDFDGKGHTVSGLNITGNKVNGNDYAAHVGGIGFFGQISSPDTTNDVRKISNLTVEGDVQTTATNAAIVGGLVGKNSVELLIENCNFKGTVKSKTGTTVADTVGGLVATNLKKLTLENCSFDGTVYTAFATNNNYQAASGLICTVAATLDINHCSVSGLIDGIGRGGSFIGMVNGNYVANVTNSYSVAEVTGYGAYTGTGYAAGGLIGFLATGTINLSNCFYAGVAPVVRTTSDGSTRGGPIINHNYSGTFNCTNVYYDADKNNIGSATYNHGIGKTTTEFKDGTVVALLNTDEVIFVQGENHPIFLTKPYSVADLNADGIIDTADAIAVLRHVEEIEEFAADAILFADVNGDENIDKADYFTVKYFALVGIVAGEPDAVSWSILG